MKLYEIIAGAQDGQAIANLARAARIEPERLDAAVQAVLPEFAHGIERNTLSRGGLADLVAALGDGHHEIILDNPAALADPRVVDDGNAILAHVFGSKERSRAVAMQAAQAAGLSDNLIRMLLPYIAQMAMGAIAKWAKGGLGDVIQKLPNGQGSGQGGAQGGGLPFPMPQQGQPRSSGNRGGGLGGGFELPRSDAPQGGFPMPPMPGGAMGQRQPQVDDQDGSQGAGGGFQIPWPRQQGQQPPRRSAGGASGGFGLPQTERPDGGFPMPPMPGGSMGGSTGDMQNPGDTTRGSAGGLPLPLPGGAGCNNPYGDLSDILRRGAKIGGTPSGGLVRNVLGGLLGFGGRGLIGWFMRLIFLRFGWGLLKRVLGRALTGR